MAKSSQEKPQAKTEKSQEKAEKAQNKGGKGSADIAALTKKLILDGADIVAIGEEAELIVGGKNYNTAIISQISGLLGK